jgi:hypothetical protein
MFYSIAELHEKKQPFAVIVSHEIIGTIYSKVYKNNYLLVEEMSGSEINYFSDIKKEMKFINSNDLGYVWEYRNFKREMSSFVKHNFLVRNKVIKGDYL